MPDTVLDSGDTKVTKAIIFGLKDSATITVQFEHSLYYLLSALKIFFHILSFFKGENELKVVKWEDSA